MKAKYALIAVVVGSLAPCPWQHARGDDSPAQLKSVPRPTDPSPASAADADAQAPEDEQEKMPDVPEPSRERQPDRRRTRGAGRNEKNHASVKTVFREAVSRASKATVRILADGQAVALGTVLDPDGYVVTKASVLEGELACRMEGGRELEARIVGVNQDYDLALVKMAAGALTPAPWRAGEAPPPGSLVAAIGPEDDLMAVGIVSTEPRRIRGSTRPDAQQGWLGIGLGDGDSGLTIGSVQRGSAAEKAGLKVGDRVQRIDGKTMKSDEQVVETIRSHAAGDPVKLVIRRDAEEIELAATLGRRRARWSPYDHWGGGPFSRRRWGFPLALAHDAAVHPNDCGGPLVDTDGNVVGINIARALRVTTYAVPADAVRKVMKDLRASQSETGTADDGKVAK